VVSCAYLSSLSSLPHQRFSIFLLLLPSRASVETPTFRCPADTIDNLVRQPDFVFVFVSARSSGTRQSDWSSWISPDLDRTRGFKTDRLSILADSSSDFDYRGCSSRASSLSSRSRRRIPLVVRCLPRIMSVNYPRIAIRSRLRPPAAFARRDRLVLIIPGFKESPLSLSLSLSLDAFLPSLARRLHCRSDNMYRRLCPTNRESGISRPLFSFKLIPLAAPAARVSSGRATDELHRHPRVRLSLSAHERGFRHLRDISLRGIPDDRKDRSVPVSGLPEGNAN